MTMKPHTILSIIPILLLVFQVENATARTTVEAYFGQPFGVGHVTVDVPHGALIAPPGDDRIHVIEANGRVLYPVIPDAPVRRILRQFLEIESPAQVTIHFLFRGRDPLDLTVYAPTAIPIRIQPEDHPRKHRRELNAWWQQVTGTTRNLERDKDYPIVVQNYLATMLARRLGLRLPKSSPGLFQNDDANEALGILLGTESIRAAIQKDLLLGNGAGGESIESAEYPLPEPLIPPSVNYPPIPGNISIEPIALHVPHECLYVRFGTFSNYLWLRDFMDQWGGDMASMIAVRGINYHLHERIEQQLGLKQTALAEILGPTVIADIAIVGSDVFLREGAAIGILFQARNNLLLGNDIRQQRKEAKSRYPDATEETFSIDGHEVSYISNPGGTMRSYYAADGDFHFVTTSRTLIRRFLETGHGTGALGQSDEFRHARTVLPVERNDTIFAYLSDAFMSQMVGPHYRVEMTRRMRSLAEMDMVRIARLAACAEGLAAHSIEELVLAGLLPPGFGIRPDGSRLIETEGQWTDSLRGARGTFVPIPDISVQRVTAREAAAYERFGAVYQNEWKRIDPIMAAIQRTPLDTPNLDRMTIELFITPYHQATYGLFVDFLGPPTQLAKAPIPGDLASLEVVLSGRFISPLKGQPPTPWHIFGALRDSHVPLEVRQGRLPTDIPTLETIRGYLGAWPRPGLFDTLFRVPGPVPFDEFGYAPAQSILGKDHWQRRFDDWFVFSFKRDVLEEVTPHLAMIERERPAQIRLRIEDLTGKDLAGLVHAFGYQQARKASASGSRFMNSLTRQLHVAPAECKAVAEEILGGTLQCPLGGTYQPIEYPGGMPVWVSDALPPENQFTFMQVPDDYTFPLLTWFRGITGELNLTGDALSAHIELDVQNKESATDKPALPSLKLPSLGFGKKKYADKKPEEPTPANPPESLAPPDPDELPPPR
ncbi:MAG: hypothetical protein JW829_08580 [Pirellulales bacterium]|nr:hypothetical protein [Pirellulales bacterium]